ncbi:hypothetical protein RZS08_33800, partial [Arthrospira platensis SPKY1]|nr:hypothetical protein [Arthrospira platensis SPKY1]
MTFFGLTYLGLETVLLALLDETTAERITERMNVELKLLEPFKGLAFCVPVHGTGGIDIAEVHRYVTRQGATDSLDEA